MSIVTTTKYSTAINKSQGKILKTRTPLLIEEGLGEVVVYHRDKLPLTLALSPQGRGEIKASSPHWGED